ncbi:AAA family ATPase [Candidatus Rariloculus sp.]|uniref:ExeA family protein n=1 Tax=Candidatus Rariloculus sp. TaxID=3101265 RepID=UPI003D0D45A6
MYTAFFGLDEKPFSITPDPRYLYLSQRHADALAHLIYGISESGGFIQLTGEVGTGKTTLIRSLLEQLPEKAEVALILNPQLSTKEFLRSICQELRIETPKRATVKDLIDLLNERLLRAHAEDRRIVLIVDEAQTLSPALLEQVRLLTNLETAKRKLLQIVLIGQPELRQLLARGEMRQIAQRVTGRYHLEPLSAEDTVVYVKHRMKVAGARAEVFSLSAVREIYRKSGGVPRLINVVSDRALLAAYTQDRTRIDRRLIRRAAAEVFGKRPERRWWPWAAAGATLAILALAAPNLRQADEDAARYAVEATPASQALPVVAAPVEPPSSIAQGSLVTLLASNVFSAGADAAVGDLLALWGVDYDPALGAVCEQAAAHGLQCLALDDGSISQLRRLDRPAVLALMDADGAKYHAVMSALEYEHAELSSGGQTHRVGVVDLTHHWYGEQLLLWKPLIAEGRDLAPGTRDEGVRGLRESLAAIRDVPLTGAASDLYDPELEAWVRELQSARGLSVDGIVGALTQIAIHTDLGLADTPLLSRVD